MKVNEVAAALRPTGHVEYAAPTLEILQARAYDALHSYIVAATGYDHTKATPTFNKLARHIEGELELANVGEGIASGSRSRGAEPRSKDPAREVDAPSPANVPRGR